MKSTFCCKGTRTAKANDVWPYGWIENVRGRGHWTVGERTKRWRGLFFDNGNNVRFYKTTIRVNAAVSARWFSPSEGHQESSQSGWLYLWQIAIIYQKLLIFCGWCFGKRRSWERRFVVCTTDGNEKSAHAKISYRIRLVTHGDGFLFKIFVSCTDFALCGCALNPARALP